MILMFNSIIYIFTWILLFILDQAFLEAVINLQFSLVENLWQQFWRTSHSYVWKPIIRQYNFLIARTLYLNDVLLFFRDSDLEDQLCTTKLYLLCGCEGVQKFVQRADYKFYQNLVEVLIPDVLRPIPSKQKVFDTWRENKNVPCTNL